MAWRICMHLRKGVEAAAEFHKVLDRKGASWGSTSKYPNWGRHYSISHLGCGAQFRACERLSESQQSRPGLLRTLERRRAGSPHPHRSPKGARGAALLLASAPSPCFSHIAVPAMRAGREMLNNEAKSALILAAMRNFSLALRLAREEIRRLSFGKKDVGVHT